MTIYHLFIRDRWATFPAPFVADWCGPSYLTDSYWIVPGTAVA